ncbi:hypothetical protein LCGC14_1962320 [marine sediment metagenome]|uniref:Uncharacterized protein n=1 Tax=marine sediment metagenome TaxID=412755 RepID=A0A0F9HSK9_9ZZZZ
MSVSWRVTVSPGSAKVLYDNNPTISRMTIKVKNPAVEGPSIPVYIGGSNVTYGTGYMLESGEDATFTIYPHQGEGLYAKSNPGGIVTVQCTKGTD